MNQPNWDINEDKAAKKQLVAEYITSKCEYYSHVEELQQIGACLSKGSKLEVTNLTGGLINYSYKISCRDTDTRAEHKLFAKLSFAYIISCPDKTPMSLDRAETEYEMLSTIQKLSPGSAPTPYFCDDVEGDMKLLVCQWSPVEEQLGDQLVKGAVDLRTAEKVAQVLSRLHLVDDFDPDFGPALDPEAEEATKSYLDKLPDDLCKSERQDRVGTLAREMGKDALAHMFDTYLRYAEIKDCLIHGDLHCLNILGASKPSISDELDDCDSLGEAVIIDWELAKVGGAGQDIGFLIPIPTACAFAHWINGNHDAAKDCLAWIDTFWSTYESTMRDNGSSEDDIAKIFRFSLQMCGWNYWNLSAVHPHMDILPVDEGSDDLERIKQCCGVLFLKCMELGTNESLTLQELKDAYNEAVKEEMDSLVPEGRIERDGEVAPPVPSSARTATCPPK